MGCGSVWYCGCGFGGLFWYLGLGRGRGPCCRDAIPYYGRAGSDDPCFYPDPYPCLYPYHGGCPVTFPVRGHGTCRWCLVYECPYHGPGLGIVGAPSHDPDLGLCPDYGSDHDRGGDYGSYWGVADRLYHDHDPYRASYRGHPAGSGRSRRWCMRFV